MTGRAAVLPNSILLDKRIINESFTHDLLLSLRLVSVKTGLRNPRSKRRLCKGSDRVQANGKSKPGP
jgi:hypothetical protein